MPSFEVPIENSAPIAPTQLTPELITFATGEENIEKLEEIEIIFNTVTRIGGLERCRSLRSLTLIDCNLKKISDLEPVSRTLVRLCLCDNALKKMAAIRLPVLRELFLHQNSITKIEGLEGCPQLQRLWLFSNRISVIEGLHHCGSLKELWIQDNKIKKIEGLSSLPILQSLGLAGNPIADLRDIEPLTLLPLLTDVTFDDVHFGSCPAVHADGYRAFTVCCLKQIRRLDGVEVKGPERTAAEGDYMRQALAFQSKVDAMREDAEREVAAIEERRKGNDSVTQTLKSEVVTALKEVETLVMQGRAAIAKEHEKRRGLHKQNLAALETALADLQRSYKQEIDRRVQLEQQRMFREDSIFRALECRAAAETFHAEAVATLSHRKSPPAHERDGSHASNMNNNADSNVCSCAELGEHTHDFHFLQRLFSTSQGAKTYNSAPGRRKGGVGMGVETTIPPPAVCLLKAYRLYCASLVTSFAPLHEASTASESGATNDTRANGHTPVPIQTPTFVYMCASDKEVNAVCRGGLTSLAQLRKATNNNTCSQYVIVHADPGAAARAEGSGFREHFARSGDDDVSSEEESDVSDEGSDASDHDVRETAGGGKQVRDETADEFEEGCGEGSAGTVLVLRTAFLVPGVLMRCNGPPPGSEEFDKFVSLHGQEHHVVEVSYTEVNTGVSSRYYIIPPVHYETVLPEYHVLAGWGPLAQDSAKLERELETLNTAVMHSDTGRKGDDLLVTLERRMAEEVSKFNERANLGSIEADDTAVAERIRQLSLRVKSDREGTFQHEASPPPVPRR